MGENMEDRLLASHLRWTTRALAMAFVAITVAACSSDQEDTAPCPAAEVLAEPSELTRFREGPGRDPTDIVFEARMMRVTGECSYDTGGGDIELELEVLMDVSRGAALADGQVDFRYFVAVSEWRPDGGSEPAILSRESFKVGTAIPAGRRGLRYRDLLEITIPRPDDRSVQNYVLYLGFELTKDELSYNKKKFGY